MPAKGRRPDYERPEMPFERDADVSPRGAKMATVGFEFGLVVALFFLGGLFLDGKLGTKPWLAASGAMAGIAVGMFLLIRRVARTSGPQDGGSKGDRRGR